LIDDDGVRDVVESSSDVEVEVFGGDERPSDGYDSSGSDGDEV